MNISIFLICLVFFMGLMFCSFIPIVKVGFYLLEWDFLSLKFNFYFNSILFSFILFLVTLSVLVFSSYYLNGELNFNYYYFVLLIFVGSMFMLNFSNSIFTMMLSWDLLGISSFFLVLFYNNWDSCSGAMNTALTNRLGDYFMFIFFSGSIFSGYYFLSFSMFSFYVSLLLLLTAFTKSAQFPFSSWLPKAMSAPTPVSSLVHSSTLVTAGLILLMNFSNLVLQKNLVSLILVIGLFTMFFSSITALVEEDLKKVVALSTLSQMGFSMVTLGLGLSFVSFIHLVSHALFKSCLFMQVGYIIHCSFGQQDGRNYSGNGHFPAFIQLQLLVTLFCLCGLIFSSGAVSKDFILEFFFSNNYMIFFSLMFFVSVFLTFGYSYRLWKSFFLSFNKVVSHYSSSYYMNCLSLVLVVFSITFLWWLNFNMLNIPSLFLYIDFFVPLFYVFLILLLSFMSLKFLLKELTYKFLVDYLAKFSVLKLKNLKFMDLFLNGLNSKGFTMFMFSSLLSNNYMKSLNFNSAVILLFFIFIMV
uniref:NADH:ubiquinone reductase (H(+)-translocating) n=2 Tax=Heterorhabditis TaxID=37861 RepID=A0A313_HETBA|nr:NADH dehydrogenase subunit 5 [Heterorhabditis indica]YP_817460.1 NADH dehydrogenase subunit 5 [Heterorhabditis bacteriophora]ABJ80704.1 NADH dehydrogenase subunit 5 [Heterorhabditis bacteriophora]AZU95945.1 NADH dehydrogenase subunit 5 [Heterorhabditis bacteriophora]QAA11090.1 NADH dehydrogenase subunit 5 [Heterorhabditis indica]QAA11102.1 NADH dehydrogenase subunit 5 [Heterorhabditis bacteriophora]